MTDRYCYRCSIKLLNDSHELSLQTEHRKGRIAVGYFRDQGSSLFDADVVVFILLKLMKIVNSVQQGRQNQNYGIVL